MTALGQQVGEIVREWAAKERGAAVHRMTVVRSAYASSATVLNVHIKLAGGERMRIVCKLSDVHIPAARGVKPDFLSDGGREAWMYESVLPSDGLADAPRLLASGLSREGGRWLLMEWAGSLDLSQVGARSVWCDTAAHLARLHVWGESRVDTLSRGALVPWDDPQLHLRWARRARGSLAEYFRAQGTIDPLAALWRRYRVVANRLAAMPKTLVHGDFNASNILVTRSRAGNRIRIIDWETAGVGPGLLDLASLVSGQVPEKRRAAMVAAYRDNLAGSRLGALSDGEFDRALTWCRLALAVQWLGWSPGWSPPRAHTYDWRKEALQLAQELGLVERA
jgi:hypothetical protein